jgi:hypothetical protein
MALPRRQKLLQLHLVCLFTLDSPADSEPTLPRPVTSRMLPLPYPRLTEPPAYCSGRIRRYAYQRRLHATVLLDLHPMQYWPLAAAGSIPRSSSGGFEWQAPCRPFARLHAQVYASFT